MSGQIKSNFITYKVAGTAVAGNRIVIAGAAANEVVVGTDATAPILGVTDTEGGPANGVVDVATGSGQQVEVKASEAISRGDAITAAAGGEAAIATTDKDFIAGYAAEAAASGDLFLIDLAPVGAQVSV